MNKVPDWRFNPPANMEISANHIATILTVMGLRIDAAAYQALPKEVQAYFTFDLTTAMKGQD